MFVIFTGGLLPSVAIYLHPVERSMLRELCRAAQRSLQDVPFRPVLTAQMGAKPLWWNFVEGLRVLIIHVADAATDWQAVKELVAGNPRLQIEFCWRNRDDVSRFNELREFDNWRFKIRQLINPTPDDDSLLKDRLRADLWSFDWRQVATPWVDARWLVSASVAICAPRESNFCRLESLNLPIGKMGSEEARASWLEKLEAPLLRNILMDKPYQPIGSISIVLDNWYRGVEENAIKIQFGRLTKELGVVVRSRVQNSSGVWGRGEMTLSITRRATPEALAALPTDLFPEGFADFYADLRFPPVNCAEVWMSFQGWGSQGKLRSLRFSGGADICDRGAERRMVLHDLKELYLEAMIEGVERRQLRSLALGNAPRALHLSEGLSLLGESEAEDHFLDNLDWSELEELRFTIPDPSHCSRILSRVVAPKLAKLHIFFVEDEGDCREQVETVLGWWFPNAKEISLRLF